MTRAGGSGPINPLTLGLAFSDVSISSAKAKRGNTVGAGISALGGQAAGFAGFYVGDHAGRTAGQIAGKYLLGDLGASLAPAASSLPWIGESLSGVLAEGLGIGLGGPIGALVGVTVGSLVGDKIGRGGTQRFYKSVLDTVPLVRFGGDFKDSQPAYTMRQKAEQELSGSLLNARRYLGREAQLMHQ